MECIIKIEDKDIGEKTKKITKPTIRKTVRTILINDEGKIAILYKEKKKEYKLIGGGIEKGETLEQALKREVFEEAGCEIKIIKELGYTEEYKTLNNFVQMSYVYVTKVIKNTHQLHLTQQEKEEGAKLCWLNLDEALEHIANSYEKLVSSEYDDLYSSKFIIKRDEAILKYYMQNR